jgi:hypothetical protein
MHRSREVLARIAIYIRQWLRAADDELDLGTYVRAAGVGVVMEVPILYFGGVPPTEIAYVLGMSLSGALGVSMLIELWLHFGD